MNQFDSMLLIIKNFTLFSTFKKFVWSFCSRGARVIDIPQTCNLRFNPGCHFLQIIIQHSSDLSDTSLKFESLLIRVFVLLILALVIEVHKNNFGYTYKHFPPPSCTRF